MHHGKIHRKGLMSFQTQSGTFTSDKTSEVEFFLSEFSESRHIKWNFHVIPDGNSKMLPYDMIIGRDLMKVLRMDVLYSENVIVWDDLRLPMQEIKSSLSSVSDFNALVQDHAEPEAVKEQMDRLHRILDANYDTPDLEEEVAKMTYLNPEQRILLLAFVVARTRRKSGKPGLSINAAALIKKVLHEIGPMPSPSQHYLQYGEQRSSILCLL